MEAKSIAASAVVSLVVAGFVNVGSRMTGKPPQELTLKPGASAVDVAVADVARQTGQVRTINAALRVSVVENAYGLHWWCDAEPCPAQLVSEIERVSAKAMTAQLIPKLVGDTLEYTIQVQEGAVPAVPELDNTAKKLLGVR